MKDLSQKVIQKIEKEKIKPRAKIYFQAKNYLLWLFFWLALFALGIILSLFFFAIFTNDWDIYPRLQFNFWHYVLFSLPLFWLIFLLFFFFLAVYSCRQTERGYRFPYYLLAAFIISGSAALGFVFWQKHLSEKTDQFLTRHLPLYQGINQKRMLIWSQPQKGLLGGIIITVIDRHHFLIKDFRGRQWKVEGKKIIWRPAPAEKKGEVVKLIGYWPKDHLFIVQEVRLWPSQKIFFSVRGKK